MCRVKNISILSAFAFYLGSLVLTEVVNAETLFISEMFTSEKVQKLFSEAHIAEQSAAACEEAISFPWQPESRRSGFID